MLLGESVGFRVQGLGFRAWVLMLTGSKENDSQ